MTQRNKGNYGGKPMMIRMILVLYG